MGSFGEVTEFGHGFKSQFLFDPKYTNLNHGMCLLQLSLNIVMFETRQPLNGRL